MLRQPRGPARFTVTLSETDPFTSTVDVFAMDRLPSAAFGSSEGVVSGATVRRLVNAVAALFDM